MGGLKRGLQTLRREKKCGRGKIRRGEGIMGRIAELFREILIEIGEDPDREGLRDTPDRVERMYAEVFAGLKQGEPNITVFENTEGYRDMVIVKEIPFSSFCEHHCIPFLGKAHVGYIPGTKYIGLSKIARIIDFFAKRLQVQERLTDQVASYLFNKMDAQGVIVMIEAEHLCMTIRGVKKSGSKTITTAIRGDIDKDEFIQSIKR